VLIAMQKLDLPQPYLVYVGDIADPVYAKTAFGIRDWARDKCVGEFGRDGALQLGMPRLAPAEARARGAKSVVIGVAPIGGAIAPNWIPDLEECLAAGLDIVSGMHRPLSEIVALRDVAEAHGRRLIDVRTPPKDLPIATGRKRQGKRLLTVGSDCALGKKYTALVLAREFVARGLAADFRATGQTGIMIAGAGIPIDAVVSDFVAGAAEVLTPDADPGHWDVIEGQGSLVHPAYAGVSLGLLHGSQPDVLVFCHKVGRTRVYGLTTEFPIPPLREIIDLNLALARRTNPNVRCAGVSLNTSELNDVDAENALREAEMHLAMPCADPLRSGRRLNMLVQACLD
jgi:uncharacterized NAD-dependent epimerase/dehydratase family protein